MFRPDMAISRQIVRFLKLSHSTNLKSIYFHSVALSLLTLICICFRTKLSLSSQLFSFCGSHVCVPFVRVFSLAEHVFPV
jgi:hypothetical protein